MSREIERKFSIESSSTPDDLDKNPVSRISQGYLTVEKNWEIRVRRQGKACFLTVKQGSGMVRKEREIRLTEQNFNKLWPLTEGRRIEKNRFVLPHGVYRIELDVYKGGLEGLVTAEVEFPSEEESEKFDPPSWFREDISEDEGFKNKNLAVFGLPGQLGKRSRRKRHG
jgi:adenylate cyclase